MINIKEFLGLTYYTSELDQFLDDLAKKYPRPSESQRLERKKYARIFRLRDIPEEVTTETPLWEKF